MSRKRRRCAACRMALPADAGPRRLYCDGACAARAYRQRKRTKYAGDLARGVTRANALMFGGDSGPDFADPIIRTAAEFLARVRCPVCGTVIWPGVRRRRDARYCSNRCRQKAARQRRSVLDHDGKP